MTAADLAVSDDLPELTFDAERFAVQRLFPTPLLMAPVNEADALNAALAPIILERAAGQPSVKRSNDGGWQSADDFTLWGGEPGRRLLEAARALADGVTAVQTGDGLARDKPDWTMNAWANVNRKGDANHPHHHPAAFWSGVYWVDAADSGEQGPGGASLGGELEVVDPRGVLPAFYAPKLKYAVSGCLSAGLSDFVTPVSGLMVLFPSWLVHSVRRYTGDGVRISVAFNLSL